MEDDKKSNKKGSNGAAPEALDKETLSHEPHDPLPEPISAQQALRRVVIMVACLIGLTILACLMK